MAPSSMALDWLLVVSCAFSVLLAIAYIFYSNRLLALLIGYILHLSWWSEGSDRAWVSLESFQISLLSGKIMIKDLNYHSSNQSFRAVKCHITWKYWIWRTRDDFTGMAGEEIKGSGKNLTLPCRIHISLDGVEWRLYNRTAAYNDILSRLQHQYNSKRTDPNERSSSISGRSREFNAFTSDPGDPSGKSTPALAFSNSYPPSTPTQISRIKSMRKALSLWFAAFKPTFQEILPIDIVGIRGAIVCGNPSTPSLLVAKYANARGSCSVLPSKSPHDKYKTSIDFMFSGVKLDFERNPEYRGSLLQHGRVVSRKIGPDPSASAFTFSAFSRLWSDQKRSETQEKINDVHARLEFSLKDHVDYAIVETILETPKLELAYYWDQPGVVSSIPEKAISEPIDVGNGGAAPEYGIDLVVYGGTVRYGPWADRQRVELQRLFFPPTYCTAEPSIILKPGDTRMFTAMKVFIELRDTTTFHVPFREPSKDWQYDENKFPLGMRKRREGGWLEVHMGGHSTINYVMPWVATEEGYDALMELHLDEVNALSSVNDIQLLAAQSSRILCQLPAPLRWNESRRWTFDISFEAPIFHLIRDHVNLLTDLGKDWSSGPPSDFDRWVPMHYVVNTSLQDFEMNLYLNDHNIITHPHARDANVMLTLRGNKLRNTVEIPSTVFRPQCTSVPFSVEIPDVGFSLSLPKWNTNATFASSRTTDFGRAVNLRVDGSFRYHSETRPEFIDQLKIDMVGHQVVFVAFGWVVRHLMTVRDNYFGNFTNFSTLNEYVTKRSRGLPVGDPVEQKWREGKSNVFEVSLGVMVVDSVVVLPSGLPGYEQSVDPASELDQPMTSDFQGLGTCAVLLIPELQNQLRTHDYSMEMSLNIAPVTVSVVESLMHGLAYEPYCRLGRQKVQIDGINILANRLFGPQPRTSTYLCLWEFQLGTIAGVMSTIELRGLSDALTSFRFNFTDAANAPASEFAIPPEPDVTFLKITLSSIDLAWVAGQTSLQLYLPQGLQLDYNDMSGNAYKKASEIRIPEGVLRALLRSGSRRESWFEAASVSFNIGLDIYSSPKGWREAARFQTAFVTTQDSLTRRAWFLYEKTPGQHTPSYLHSMFLPKPTLPRKSFHAEPVHRRLQQILQKPRISSHSRYNEIIESDEDERISEADRDARVANSRPATPLLRNQDLDDGSMSSSDESDNDGLSTTLSDTDSDGADQEESTTKHLAIPFPLLSHYKQIIRRFESHINDTSTAWSPPLFTLARDIPALVDEENVVKSSNPQSSPPAACKGTSVTTKDDRQSRVTYVIRSQGIDVLVTPLCVNVMTEILDDLFTSAPSIELTVDHLTKEYLGEISSEKTKNSSEETVDLEVFTFRFRVLQSLMAIEELVPPFTPIPSPTVASRSSRIVSDLVLNIHRFNGVFSKTNDSLPASQPNIIFRGSLSRLDTHLDVSVFHSLSQTIRAPQVTRRCTLNLGGSKIVSTTGDLYVELGDMRVQFLGKPSPEMVAATIEPLVALVQGSQASYTKRMTHLKAAQQHQIWSILQSCRRIPVGDPLTQTQPSLLVQMGRPRRIRQDPSWKLFLYLRVCLRWLGVSNRKAIHKLSSFDIAFSSIQIDDFATVLLERLPDWGFELSGEEIPHLPFIRHCFQAVQSSINKASQKDRDLPVISFHSGSLSFSVLEDSDPLDVLGNTLTLGPFHLAYRFKDQMVTTLPVKIPNVSSTAFRAEPDTVAIRHHVLSFVMDNIRFTIHPSFIIFLQHLLSLHGKYLRYPSSGSIKPTLGAPHPRADDYLEMFVNVKQISIQAAVEGMVLEVGLADVSLDSPILRTVSGISRTQPKIRQFTSASGLLKLSRAYTCVRQAQDKADPFSSNGRDHDILTRLDLSSLLVQASCRISGEQPPMIHGLLTLDCMTLSVPRSALLTYRLIEEWRTQYLSNINAMAGELFSELNKRNKLLAPRAQIKAPKRSLYPSITFQSSVRQVGMSLQVMHGTWFSWDVHDIIGLLRNVTDMGSSRFTFGVQLASQLIRIGSRLEGGAGQAAKSIKLALPSFRISGNYNTRQLSCHAIIDRFSLPLKPKYVDDILVVQQNLGTHFYDVLDLIAESRAQKPASKKPLKPGTSLKYNVAFMLQGFRIEIEGPTTTLALTSAQMTGTAKNDDGFAWDFSVSTLALAMSHHSTDPRPRSEFDRSMRSAYMVLDVKASSAPRAILPGPRSQLSHILRLRVNRMHAVMSPNSIGELGDLLDHVQAEKHLRQEQRALELEEIKNKTKRVIKAFEVRKPSTSSKRSSSFLDDRSVLIEVADIGVAFPLALRNEIEVDSIGSVPAFLMSIKSAAFSLRRYESGHASMGRLSFQFVKQFDQSRPSQFDGDEHQSRNKLLYPGMKADFCSRTSAITRQWQIAADVDGFILNLDPTIVDNVFGLVDVYRKGKERIDRLTTMQQTEKVDTEYARAITTSVEASFLAIRTSNIFITLIFHTGELYLHGIEAENDPPNKRSMLPDVIHFPTFTVSSEYRVTPAASKVSSSLEQERSALIFRSQIHTTINRIRPSIFAFLTGFAERIEERLRRRNMEPPMPPMSDLSEDSDVSNRESRDFLATDVLNGILLSFSLRIDSSRLELDCGHDLGVVAALHWESGGFLVTLSPEARTVHFAGSVTGIQIDLRHLKHQAGTVRTGNVDARNLAFSATYSLTENADGDNTHSVSVVIDTEFGAALRFDRLQDILIFKAIYIDRLPGAVSQAPTKSASTAVKSPGGIPGMTTLVLVQVRHIKLLVDLGHNIASAVIDLEKVLLQSKITGPVTDLSVSVAQTSLHLEEERPLGGYMRLPDFSFSTIRRSDIRLGMKDGVSKMLEVSLTSGNLDIVLQSEKRTLLQYHAEPFDIRIADDWTAMDWDLLPGDRTLRLDFSVIGQNVLAVANLQSAPRIIVLLAKLRGDLNAQRTEARNALSSSSIAQLPKPDSALSQVAEAMIRSARSKVSDGPAFSYTIVQCMKMSLSTLRVALFKSPNDSEMALFQGKDVHAELERVVHSLDTPPSRSLKLAFSSLYLSKYSSLKYRATEDELMAVAWLDRLLKGASEWTIARVPAMNLEMNSDVEYEGRQEVLQYDLVATPDESVQSSRSIYVSLNLSLYIWAGALVKGLGVEIDKALAVSGFNRPIVKVAAAVMASPPTSYPTTTSHDDTKSRPTEAISPAEHANTSSPLEPQEVPVRLPRKYHARSETSIDYGTIQQLGEATPDAEAPWLGLKETVPPRVHEYATLPMEVLMKVLLEVYSKQLKMARTEASNEGSVFEESSVVAERGEEDLD